MIRRKFIQQSSLGLASGLILPHVVDQNEKRKKPLVRFAHLTDIHVQPGVIPEKGMAQALQHVQQLKRKVDFIINGGDAIMDALERDKQQTQTQFNLFNTILKNENSLPVYHCIGNHDTWGWFIKNKAAEDQDRLYGKTWVVESFNMPGRFYRFTKGPWHFIVLDSTQLNPEGGYIGKLDEPQYEWLEQELKRVPKNEFVCLVSHIPILSICAGLFFNKVETNGDLRIPRNLMHIDYLRLEKLFAVYPQIKTAISGHIHLQDDLTYRNIRYLCNGAVSGNWWKGSFHNFGPAYSIMEFYQDGTCNRERVEYDKV